MAAAIATGTGRVLSLSVLAVVAWVAYEVAAANRDYAAAREAEWDQDFWDHSTHAMEVVQNPEVDLEVDEPWQRAADELAPRRAVGGPQ